MAAPAQFQTGVSTFADVQSQPNYQKLPSDVQAQIALDYFDKRVASQSGYQSAPADAQQSIKQDFIAKYNIPVPDAQPRQKAQPVAMQQLGQGLGNLFNAGVKTVGGIPGAIKGAAQTEASQDVANFPKSMGERAVSIAPAVVDMFGGLLNAPADLSAAIGNAYQGKQQYDPAWHVPSVTQIPGGTGDYLADLQQKHPATWFAAQSLIPLERAASLFGQVGKSVKAAEALKGVESAAIKLPVEAIGKTKRPVGLAGIKQDRIPVKSAPITARFGSAPLFKARAAERSIKPRFDSTLADLEATAKDVRSGRLKATDYEIAQLSAHLKSSRAAAAGVGELPSLAQLNEARQLSQKLKASTRLTNILSTKAAQAKVAKLEAEITRTGKASLDPKTVELRAKLEKTALADKRKALQAEIKKRTGYRIAQQHRLKEQLLDARQELKELQKGQQKPERPLHANVEKTQAKQQVRPEQQAPKRAPEAQAPNESQSKSQEIRPGKKVSTRQEVKAVAQQVANKQGMAEFYYHAEGGRSQVNENRIVAEGTARDGRTEANKLGGEDLNKGIGVRKELVSHLEVKPSGDTVMYTVNENGQFRTRIIEGKGQGSKVEWIKPVSEESPYKVETVDGKKVVINKKTSEIVEQRQVTEAAKHTSARNSDVFGKLFQKETIEQFSEPVQKILGQAKNRGRLDEMHFKAILKQLEKDREQLAKFCNFMGLK